MNIYPRETIEFVGISVAIDGAITTDGIQFALTTFEQRPTDWIDAVILGGKTGVMIDGLEPGVYTPYAKLVNDPETPVLQVDAFQVT